MQNKREKLKKGVMGNGGIIYLEVQRRKVITVRPTVAIFVG